MAKSHRTIKIINWIMHILIFEFKFLKKSSMLIIISTKFLIEGVATYIQYYLTLFVIQNFDHDLVCSLTITSHLI